MDNWLDVFAERAAIGPQTPAVTDEAGTITYRELHEQIEARAADLYELGLRPHDVVAVVARNSARFLVEILAIQRTGGLAALVNWRLAPREIAGLFDMIDPWAVATDEASFDLVTEVADADLRRLRIDEPLSGAGAAPPLIAERLTPDAPFVLMHSSGTTGIPKLIPMKNGSMIFEADRLAAAVPEIADGAAAYRIGPLFHLAGLAQATIILRSGGHLHLPVTFDPEAALRCIEEQRIALLDAAPAALRAIVETARAMPGAFDTSSLREMSYGGAPIEPTLVDALHETFGCRLRQFYGSTEAAVVVSMLEPDDHHRAAGKITSAGQPTGTWEWRLVDPDGVDVAAPDTPGELQIRGPWLTEGYWNNPEANARAFTPDGFYRMGDIVTIDTDGYFTVADRVTDMIISGGENIYPREVELVLDEHPSVREAAAIGIPSERWGESVRAVVVLEPGSTVGPQALISWCRERLAHFKCPSEVRFVEVLPRTATGKILRRELRADTG